MVDTQMTKIFGDQSEVMEALLKNSPSIVFPQPGTIIEGSVTEITKNKILVDLGGISTGIIAGKEAHDSIDTLKELHPGDNISAYILEAENSDGLVVLSLRRASQEKSWQKFVDAYESGEVIQVSANEANKGGLLLEIDGIKGFIPVSQLAPMHYPRVNGADSALILSRLQALVGINFDVKVINVDHDNGKLILSEKAAMHEQRKDALTKLKVGQKIKGKISGIVKFGIFVAFEGLEGLVHISEIAWGHVKDPSEFGRINNEVEVLVIGIDGEKISLSMKRLVPDPWVEAAKTFKVGKVVKGEINKITQFGAFMKLNSEINGLIHLSELSHDEIKDVSEIIKVGDEVEAKIITVDPKEHRIGLSIKALTEKPAEKETPEKKETEVTKTEEETPAEDVKAEEPTSEE
ncbi:S1 RNA-binding domain-containing protein [Patescibacteria group bacterium]|nr:S1 RNA-binding domain-containing protein [Patescibacteria group bacterium]